MNPLRKHHSPRHPRPAMTEATRFRVRTVCHWAITPGCGGVSLPDVMILSEGTWTTAQARKALRTAVKAGLLWYACGGSTASRYRPVCDLARLLPAWGAK